MNCVSSSGCAQHLKQHLKESSVSCKKWESEKVYIVNHINHISTEVINCQFVFKICIFAKLIDVWAINHVNHELDSQLDPAGQGLDGSAED